MWASGYVGVVKGRCLHGTTYLLVCLPGFIYLFCLQAVVYSYVALLAQTVCPQLHPALTFTHVADQDREFVCSNPHRYKQKLFV